MSGCTACAGGSVTRWNGSRSGRCQRSPSSSDGRFVAGGAPTSAILWNAVSGQRLFYLRGHTDHLTSVSFARARPTLLTSSLDGTVRTFACDVCVGLPTLIHLAEIRLAQTR